MTYVIDELVEGIALVRNPHAVFWHLQLFPAYEGNY